MLFNTSKCKVMHIGKSQQKYPYYMNNQQLEEVIQVTQEKELGILISNDLRSLSTVSISMYQSNENSGNCQPYYCVQTSGYYVTSLQVTGQPHLEYCTAAWSPHYCKDKELIERVQRRFTRMIAGLKDLSYEQRLAKTKLWSLEDRRTRADLIEVYKIIHGLTTVRFNTFF